MPTLDERKTDPSIPDPEYEVMADRWQTISDLLGDTEAMRAAGDRYLPRHHKETDRGWRNRVATCVLLNRFAHTLSTLCGKVFCNPIVVGEGTPEEIQTLFTDIDLRGNDLDVFAQSWFREGMAKGVAYVLVDTPRIDQEEKPSLEDVNTGNLRPYWNFIKPENVIALRTEVVKGKERITHVRIREEVQIVEGFAVISKPQIRVLEPGTVQIYSQVKDKGKEQWVKTQKFATELPIVPLIVFVPGERQGNILTKPPLYNLADLNITHWQSTSDQRHILTVGRFPMLACSGSLGTEADGKKEAVIGPDKLLHSRDPQGRFYYVEHTGTAIAAGDKDLLNLETQMSMFGAQMLTAVPGSQTATEKAIDTAEAMSPLQQMAGKFVDSMELALQYTALFMGKEASEAGELSINVDWAGQSVKVDIAQLREARKAREISRSTYLEALNSAGMLPENFDEEEDQEKLLSEPFVSSPEQLAQLVTLRQQGDLTFNEFRKILRDSGLAYESDAKAKAERDDGMEYSPVTFPPKAGGAVPPGQEEEKAENDNGEDDEAEKA